MSSAEEIVNQLTKRDIFQTFVFFKCQIKLEILAAHQ